VHLEPTNGAIPANTASHDHRDMLHAARRVVPKKPAPRVYLPTPVKPRDVFYRAESRYIQPILKPESNAKALKEKGLAISGAKWSGNFP
jgi:hypothetical protein